MTYKKENRTQGIADDCLKLIFIQSKVQTWYKNYSTDRITQILQIPRVKYSLAVTPLEAMCRWTKDFFDDEWSLPRGGQLEHVVGLLDMSQY
jgi:hypothetical protein